MAGPIAIRQPTIKSKQEIALMRKAGHIVAEVLEILMRAAKPGVATIELDRIAKREIEARGGIPSFLGYLGYRNCICTSFNEEIVHGIPGSRVIREGDILSIDCGAIYGGFQGDAAVTICIGDVLVKARKLVEDTKQSLVEGIAAAGPGARLGNVSHAVQTYAESRGYGVIREYVGHGIGREMHEEPMVPNFGPAGRGIVLRPGLAIAIEPMLALGGWETVVGPDQWTVSTKDGSLSAHFEHTIVITDTGAEVLTSLDGKP